MQKLNFFLLTGGPGMGKTTILNELKSGFGYLTQAEAGRQIIQEQVKSGGSLLPWADKSGYAAAMFAIACNQYKYCERYTVPVIFDRGIPDILGFLQLSGLPVPADYQKTARSLCYNPKVFLTPPWKEIYHQDRERKQSWETAIATYRAMRSIYTALGYTLLEIPFGHPTERAAYVNDAIMHT